MENNIIGGKKDSAASFRRDGSPRTAGAITPNKGGYKIADTSTTAMVGDLYRAETAVTSTMVKREYQVIEANTNDFTIASKDLPVLGDTFYILAGVTPRYDSTGAQQATIDTTGLATSANQATEITALGTLNTSINTLLKPASTLAGITTVAALTAITNALPAGTNLLGKVGIDQTTPGTTNLVALAANQSVNVAQMNGVTTTMGNGVAGTGVQRVAVASDNTPFPVKIDQTTPGTTNLVALAANQSVNNAQINGVTPLMGNGVSGTGSQRVTIASDNTAFSVNATLSAETSKVIGTVNISAAQTIGTVTTITNTVPTGEVPSAAATNALTRVMSTAAEASHVLKASAGRLYMLVGYNARTSSQFIQVHNTTTVVADTAVPIYTFTVPAQSNFSLDLTPLGDYFATGIMVCNSSTMATKTIGSADCWFNGLVM